MWQVKISRKLDRKAQKLPDNVKALFIDLLNDLKYQGPEQPGWPNYSKLGKNEYYCHLNYRYVACWRNENGTLIIEVYYAGSREGAPY